MSASNSFKLVPTGTPINTMSSSQHRQLEEEHLRLSHGTPAGDIRRRVFIGGIGTELTSRDLVKAFRAVGMDIVNKPVRILRGKKFNFAPNVELKTEEQCQRIISMKLLEVGGSTLEIRAHRVRRKVRNPKQPSMSQEVREALFIERRNKLKLKLYELKLMEAENLLMKAKIEREIRACQSALQEDKRLRNSRSYGRNETVRKNSTPVFMQNINIDNNLTQAQKQYLKKFQRTEYIPMEPRRSFGRKMSTQHLQRDMIISRSYTRMGELDKKLEGVRDQFYPTEKPISEQSLSQRKTVSNEHFDMSISSIWGSSSPVDDLDPPLVENLGSLADGSMDNIVFEKMNDKEKLKKVQMNFENLDKPRDSSQILLLVKDDISDDIKIEDVMAHCIAITAH